MAEFRSPARANQPLNIAVNGKLDRGLPGHRRQRRLTSTAKQVVDAINAKPEAAALVLATTYRGNAGAGIVPVRARTNLSDFLNAPASYPRGPFQQHLYRIGTHRDGTKPGVYLFCQQHAREWATSLTCQETAHELVENYATDPRDQAAPRQRRGLHLAELQPGRRRVLDVRRVSVQRKTMIELLRLDGNTSTSTTRPRAPRGAST